MNAFKREDVNPCQELTDKFRITLRISHLEEASPQKASSQKRTLLHLLSNLVTFFGCHCGQPKGV